MSPGVTMPVRLMRDLGIGVYHGRETLSTVARFASHFVETLRRCFTAAVLLLEATVLAV